MLAFWIVIGLVVGVAGWGWLSTHRMLHPIPRFLVAGNIRPSPRTLTLTSADGASFEVWILEAQSPRGVIVTCHGYRANRLQVAEIAGALCRRGYTTVLFDLRGHGTRREACCFGIRDVQDVGAILEWRTREPALAQLPVGILGLSMGASAACQATLRYPDIEALVLDSAYANLFPILAKSVRRDYGLPTPFAWITWFGTSLALGHRLAHVDPIYLAPKITKPVLIIQGLDDQTVPPASAHALAARWGGPTEEWTAPHIGHVGMFVDKPDAYADRAAQFFDRWLHRRPLPC